MPDEKRETKNNNIYNKNNNNNDDVNNNNHHQQPTTTRMTKVNYRCCLNESGVNMSSCSSVRMSVDLTVRLSHAIFKR